MRKICFGIIMSLVIPSMSQAQEKPRFFQWKKDHHLDLHSLDTTTFLKPYGAHKILLDSAVRPIDIPNLIQSKKVDSTEYSTMPIKKLSGRNSVRMPGTEKLDRREQLEDAMKSKGYLNSLKRHKK